MKKIGILSTILLLSLLASAHAQTPKLIQTGDPAKRGLKESDFPRTKELAPGVYSYEALRGGDPGGFMTTNSLIVVTTDGVLVADGQGNVKQAQEMVDAIAKLTPQPIKYVIICSDHGDHTAGNSVSRKRQRSFLHRRPRRLWKIPQRRPQPAALADGVAGERMRRRRHRRSFQPKPSPTSASLRWETLKSRSSTSAALTPAATSKFICRVQKSCS